jgi:hypothetical protein
MFNVTDSTSIEASPAVPLKVGSVLLLREATGVSVTAGGVV